jgi:hypothetical protein
VSQELKIRDSVVAALCAAAGLEPKSVGEIWITPEAVTYEVFMEPEQTGCSGTRTVFVTHPYS